ncbi:DNA-directed RNA polymerase III subunit RPC5-like [Sycon ciliatum]|uniref:DNA-directed RNA polymerase III subunit RPC5-like n=1 Tax=Sycon ciliatum TaxID=27933 RepID=UPI0031F60763
MDGSGAVSPEALSPVDDIGEDEEDDPVVNEIPVYAAQSLAKSLFLFQYPLQSAATAHLNSCPTAARFKPVQKKVQLDVPVQTGRSTYDRQKGMSIATACDGDPGINPVDPKEKVFDSDLMDKQTLSSSVACTQRRYAIGILRAGELHMTPVCASVQLRPSLHYIDRGDTQTRNSKAGKNGEDGEEEEEKKGKTVTVRFAKPESEQAKAARLASYKHFEEESAKEKWVDVPVYSETTDSSQVERDYLYTTTSVEDRTAGFETISCREYLKKLCPDPVNTVE